MSDPDLRLPNAPIIEAVLEVDCDMPATFDLAALEVASRSRFGDQYPKFRTHLSQQYRIEQKANQTPTYSTKRAVKVLQFLQDDEKQLVQMRAQGFSFNRLAPYTSLDDYLPEIERTWKLFAELAMPIEVQVVRLRYINRILLPLTDGLAKLEEYLKVSPRLPDQDNLQSAGFLNQHAAVELDTGHRVNVVLASQQPDKQGLPVIFDICVASAATADPKDWPWILARIQSLRSLKNRIFKNTVTEKCLNLFQQH